MGAMGSIFGGGVSPDQANQAGKNLLGIGTTATGQQGQQQQTADVAGGYVTPFWRNQLMQGLPWYNAASDFAGGTTAQSFAPGRANILRQTSAMGTNTPSGYRAALLNNWNANQANAYDNSRTQLLMMNQQAKEQAAAGLQGQQQIAQNAALQYGNLGAGANQAILQAPQRGGILQGLAGAAGGVGSMMTGAGVMRNAGFFGA